MSSKLAVWRDRLEAWRESGESAASFCRSRRLSYAQFVYWQRALRSKRDEAVPLVPVLVESSAVSSPAVIEVVLPNGLRVFMPFGDVAEAIALVRGLSC